MVLVKNKIRKIREYKNISGRQLSARTGISNSQINRIENNLQSPTLDKLYKIAVALDKRMEDLIEDPRDANKI